VLTFGLATADRAEEILVRWPSGGIDVLAGVGADTTLTVVEGNVTPVMISGLRARETGDGIEISWYLARADAVNGLTVLRSVDGRESVPVNSGLLAPVQGETRILDHPTGLSPGATLVYRLMAIGEDGGAGEVPGEARLVYSDLAGRVNALAQNRPNPFNPRTVIPFNLAASGQATLRIYDVAGRVVRTLVDTELEPGTHQIAWDGTNEHGTPDAPWSSLTPSPGIPDPLRRRASKPSPGPPFSPSTVRSLCGERSYGGGYGRTYAPAYGTLPADHRITTDQAGSFTDSFPPLRSRRP